MRTVNIGQEYRQHLHNLNELRRTQSRRHHPDLTTSFSFFTALKIFQLFLAVKLGLYVLVYFTPYLYDTSSYTVSLLFTSDGSDTIFGARLGHLIRRLAIWDHVFFISSSANEILHPAAAATQSPMIPYFYEHEWAFGYGWIAFVKSLGTRLYSLVGQTGDPLYYFSFVAIVLANISHYLACLVLYFLTYTVYSSPQKPLLIRIYDFVSGVTNDDDDDDTDDDKGDMLSSDSYEWQKKEQGRLTGVSLARYADKIALKSSLLYALSPAGVFLAAGYSEALFALFSFLALYYREINQSLTAALLFSFSSAIRGNGLLWGLVYIYDAITIFRGFYYTVYRPSTPVENLGTTSRYRSMDELTAKRRWYTIPLQRRFSQVVGGGLILALCFFGVQFLAYRTFCKIGPENGCPAAEWCTPSDPNRGLLHIPLIYSHIQGKYWGVGFLKYWTPNNIPNFLFSMPTLIIILASIVHYYKQNEGYWRLSIVPSGRPLKRTSKKKEKSKAGWGSRRNSGHGVMSPPNRVLTYAPSHMTPYLIVSGVLAMSALLVWNVQIITRVASCLPTVYWYTAEKLTSTRVRDVKVGRAIVRYFVIWIVIQGIFFAAFLPPA